MRIDRHKRQILLFIAAILAPAAVLVGVAGQMVYQDQELTAGRAAVRKQIALDQLRRELYARLEAVKLEEVNRLMRPAAANQNSGSPAVLFIARFEGDRLVFPWEMRGTTESPAVVQHQQEGEAREFAKKDLAGAEAAYRLALAAAGPSHGAEARLSLARVIAKLGRMPEALRLYQTLLSTPPDARDDQGVGYRFYAAERLAAAGDRDAAIRFLRNEIAGDGWITLPELHMIRPILQGDPEPGFGPRIVTMEQVSALATNVARVRAQVEAAATTSGTGWVPYGLASTGPALHGSAPWLVTVIPAQPPLPGLLLTVLISKINPPGVKLGTGSGEGDTLGESFPGLRVQWTDRGGLDPPRTGFPMPVWISGLALVVGVALFGGYLLLRDVNRDVRMTEVRSQFVASVSHELKTPLTGIRMFAETLAMGRSRDDQTRSEYLETIVSESERLARLVDNVLDFSRIEQGKKLYRLQPMQLEEVAGSAMRALQFSLSQQGFQVHFTAGENLPELHADADAIQQAILNLLTNAMKYSGGSREIEMRLASRNGGAVIEVEDHGLGLAPAEQKRIFEKFYRAPSHESHLIAGTGLGLTLVAHIVAAHGGRVEVESAPGAGSTFSIFLPGGARA